MLNLLLLSAAFPIETVDHVDEIELNRYPEGQRELNQVIFWDFRRGRRECVDFRAVRLSISDPDARSRWRAEMTPVRVNGRYELTWADGDGTRRRVTSAAFRMSTTEFDPETENKLILKPEHRRRLSAKWR